MGQSVQLISLTTLGINLTWGRRWRQEWRTSVRTFPLTVNRGTRARTSQRVWQRTHCATRTSSSTRVCSHSTGQPPTKQTFSPSALNPSSKSNLMTCLTPTDTSSTATLPTQTTSSRNHWTQPRASNQPNTLETRANTFWERLTGMTSTRRSRLRYVQCWRCLSTPLRWAIPVSMCRLIRDPGLGRPSDKGFIIKFVRWLFVVVNCKWSVLWIYWDNNFYVF